MAGATLSGPVGDKKRITKPEKKNEKLAPVANKPADVETVQLMLNANGMKLPIDGKCTGALIKAIRTFQKSKLGYKKPDGIVDPGGKTWKAGLSKLTAKLKELENIKVYKTKINGKEVYVDQAEFERQQRALLHQVKSKANMMYGQAEVWIEFMQDADKTLQGAEGFMNAFTEFTVRAWDKGAEPPYTPCLNSRSDSSYLKALCTHSKPDWKKIQKAEDKAVKSYKKGQKAFKKYIDSRIGTAGDWAKGCEVVSEISFATVETFATGYLVVTRGMPPAQASAIASAGTAAMKNTALQVGNYGANGKFDGGKILKETLFAGATGFVGGKIGSAFANGAATKMAASLSGKFSGRLSQKSIDLFFNKFLQTGPGQGLVENSAKEAMGLFKSSVEKGKPPSSKDVQDAVIKIMTGSILKAPATKSLSAWDVKMPAKSREFFEKELTPKMLEFAKKSYAKKYGKELVEQVTSQIHKDIVSDVSKSFLGKAMEFGTLYTVDRITGTQSEAQLQKLTQEGIRSNMKLRQDMQKMIDAKLTTELERQKASAK